MNATNIHPKVAMPLVIVSLSNIIIRYIKIKYNVDIGVDQADLNVVLAFVVGYITSSGVQPEKENV